MMKTRTLRRKIQAKEMTTGWLVDRCAYNFAGYGRITNDLRSLLLRKI
jgi:hypothetical protein